MDDDGTYDGPDDGWDHGSYDDGTYDGMDPMMDGTYDGMDPMMMGGMPMDMMGPMGMDPMMMGGWAWMPMMMGGNDDGHGPYDGWNANG